MSESTPGAADPSDPSDEDGLRSRVERLEAELRAALAERDEARGLAESYRLAAKARAEEITELLRTAEAAPAPAQTRELLRLRELEKRLAVRVVVNSLEPFEKPYQALKRRVRGGRG